MRTRLCKSCCISIITAHVNLISIIVNHLQINRHITSVTTTVYDLLADCMIYDKLAMQNVSQVVRLVQVKIM